MQNEKCKNAKSNFKIQNPPAAKWKILESIHHKIRHIGTPAPKKRSTPALLRLSGTPLLRYMAGLPALRHIGTLIITLIFAALRHSWHIGTHGINVAPALGTPVLRYSGTPVHWHSGTSAHRRSGTPALRHITPALRHSGTPAHWHSGTLALRHIGTPGTQHPALSTEHSALSTKGSPSGHSFRYHLELSSTVVGSACWCFIGINRHRFTITFC